MNAIYFRIVKTDTGKIRIRQDCKWCNGTGKMRVYKNRVEVNVKCKCVKEIK